MNRLIIRTTRIFMFIYALTLAGTAYAQEYEAPAVEVSEQKVKIDGKIYYSHIVLEKQTLYSISKAYNVSVDDIYEANPGLKETGLKKNAIINIPAPTTVEAKAKAAEAAKIIEEAEAPEVQEPSGLHTHIVKWYEDLQTIADRYGVSQESIVAANNMKDKKVKSRQRLIIPGIKAEVRPIIKEVVNDQADKHSAENETETEEDEIYIATTTDQEEEEVIPALENKVKAMVLLPLKATGMTSSKSNMDFYSGVLLAARELGESGADIKLEVHDIANGSFGATKHALETSDLIIGPVSADDITRLYNIAPEIKALVSPLDPRAESLVNNYKTMIHAPASRAEQYKDIANWIKEDMMPGDTVIVISEKEPRKGDEGWMMKAAVDSAGIVYTSFSYSILEGRDIQEPLEAIMAKINTNRVLVASESEAFVNDVIRNLNIAIHSKHPVVLYGPAKIRTFDTIEVDNFHNTNLHASLTYYINYADDDVREFLLKYRALFNTEPTQFAFQGYDVAKYFLGLCSYYGGEWMQHLGESDKQMLQSLFSIRPTGDGGHSNTGIRRIIYGNNYEIISL